MQQGRPDIPIRFSSKMTKFEGQKRQLEDHIDNIKKRLKKNHSFDTTVWTDLKEVESARVKAHGLQRKISMLAMDVDDKDKESVERWASTAEAKAILEKEVVLKKKLKMITRQSDKIANQPEAKESENRLSWVQLFISSKLGLGLTKPTHSRSNERQKQFRNELIEVMNSKHPNPTAENFLWCPVTGQWCQNAIAGHLFPNKSGDYLMKVIFGEAEQDMWINRPGKGQSELFRACNGILWCYEAEERFSKGLFTIIPDLDEDSTPAQCQTWQDSNPKEYRIRVLRPEAREMKHPIKSPNDKCWVDLDNKRLQWRSNFRPRARYLYWSYCEMMLRQSYSSNSNTDAGEVRHQEVGKKYWGTAGSYIKKNMLMGFVEEMGHEYEYLMAGAIEAGNGNEDGEEPSGIAVMQANENILEKQAIAERVDSGVEWDSEENSDEEIEMEE